MAGKKIDSWQMKSNSARERRYCWVFELRPESVQRQRSGRNYNQWGCPQALLSHGPPETVIVAIMPLFSYLPSHRPTHPLGSAFVVCQYTSLQRFTHPYSLCLCTIFTCKLRKTLLSKFFTFIPLLTALCGGVSRRVTGRRLWWEKENAKGVKLCDWNDSG